jgi:hypothetical protein
MKSLGRKGWLLALLPIFAQPVMAADDPAQDSAHQVVGLFLKACVNFTGDRSGLREWAKQTGLPPLPEAASDAFLHGLPGVVYDASAQKQKLVLISEDNGSCSAIAEKADGPMVIDELERILKASQVTLTVTRDRTDPKESALRHREYTAAGAKREWEMLVSIVQTPGGGGAMLTANR